MSESTFTFDFTLMKLKHLQEAVDDVRDLARDTHASVTYLEKVIRDHEDEDGCIEHSS